MDSIRPNFAIVAAKGMGEALKNDIEALARAKGEVGTTVTQVNFNSIVFIRTNDGFMKEEEETFRDKIESVEAVGTKRALRP